MLGIAISQIRVTFVGLGMFCKAYHDRKRGLSPEYGTPGRLIKVQDVLQNEIVRTQIMEIEERFRKKIDNFKIELVETLRKDMEKIEENIVEKLKET